VALESLDHAPDLSNPWGPGFRNQMAEFRRNYLTFVVGLVITLCTPQWTSSQSPTKPSSKIPLRLLRVPLDKGVVEGGTYKNDSVGLELTPASSLKLGTPVMKGTQGSLPLLVSVSAVGERKWSTASDGMGFYVEDLAYYPENRRSTEAYVSRAVQSQEKQGFVSVKGTQEERLGGVAFARTDFRQNEVYEAVHMKACDVYAFVFIFAGEDLAAVNKLVAQTNIKLDMKNSGCGGKSDGAPQKK
jgi:hypothetical protein